MDNITVRVMHMPRIGSRMIKTAVAVFICFLIYLIRNDGIPFYSAIAAILCIRADMNDSLATAKSRVIATFIGGLAGLLFTVFEHEIIPIDSQLLRYAILSIAIIPIIYISILIKQPSTAYLSCVVFLCITVSHMGDDSYMLFAVNRMVDTLIGVAVAYIINCVHIPHRKHDDLLIMNIDSLIQSNFNTYTRVKLEKYQMAYPNLTLYSELDLPNLLHKLQDFQFQLPLIAMSGSMLYQQKHQTCIHPFYIKDEDINFIEKELHALNVQPFLYEWNLNHMVIHHTEVFNSREQEYYEGVYHLAHHHFYHHEQLHLVRNIICVKVMDNEHNLIKIEEAIKTMNSCKCIKKGNTLCIYANDGDMQEQIHTLTSMQNITHSLYFSVDEMDERHYFKSLQKFLKHNISR